MSDAIQIHRPNGAMQTAADVAWTRERVDLIKRAVCPKGITDDEFALFVEQCKRTGLDPLIKEIFCVPRRKNVGDKQNPRWITVHEAQPSEAGMLARAEKFPDFRGITAAAVYAKDTISIDAGLQTVSHSFSPVGDRGALLGAWSRIVREGREPVLVWLDVNGYRQQSPLWDKIPGTMIEKCARVAALRKAYPSIFGGVYIKEEMPTDEAAPQATVAPPEPQRPASNVRALITERSLGELRALKTPDIVDAETLPFDEPKPQPFDPLAEAMALIEKAKTAQEMSALTEQIIALGVSKDPAFRKAYSERLAALKKGVA